MMCYTLTSFLRCFLLLAILLAVAELTTCVTTDFCLFSSFLFFAASRCSRAARAASFFCSLASFFLSLKSFNTAFSFIFFSHVVDNFLLDPLRTVLIFCPGAFHERPDTFPCPTLLCFVAIFFAGAACSSSSISCSSSSTCDEFKYSHTISVLCCREDTVVHAMSCRIRTCLLYSSSFLLLPTRPFFVTPTLYPRGPSGIPRKSYRVCGRHWAGTDSGARDSYTGAMSVTFSSSSTTTF